MPDRCRMEDDSRKRPSMMGPSQSQRGVFHVPESARQMLPPQEKKKEPSAPVRLSVGGAVLHSGVYPPAGGEGAAAGPDRGRQACWVPVGAVSGPSPGRSRRKRLEPDPGQSPKTPAGGLYPAGKSGITGIIYEPWHYRYVGREVAAAVHGQGVCLEEYLGT